VIANRYYVEITVILKKLQYFVYNGREHGNMDEDMETWRHGNMETSTWNIDTWKQGDMEARRHRNMEPWKNGDTETWKHGNIETWIHGNSETWKH
jgi:hypothetical protein